ncbi:MAG: phospho-N-acetylmuramoyl-pentapeptide-transferase, partial [Clostridia bacterium]|nr:phospho-N-acetylmuramoyl-pentapeptide-transferase [Clostridia bacterium]
MIRNLLALVICFGLTLLFAPFVLSLINKLKAKQTILGYVKEHSSKQGTPTMGGIMFIIPCIVVSVFLFSQDFSLGIISLAVMFSFALLGFLDDFIKIRYKQNLGLKAYQKIIGQVGISLVVAIFVYKSNLVGTEVYIPFTNGQTLD